MARDVNKLHPKLQKKVKDLIDLCAKNGIKIGISECVRTVKEQDILYAKGRTTAGSIVTNAKGSSYSSMHQWGVAFDFYLIMDVDKDGKTSDDAYNNATGLFNKVGELGKQLGLEWGGSWKSFKDLPHFQLPDWGSTTSQLKNKYKTPENFMKTWGKSDTVVNIPKASVPGKTTVSKSSAVVAPAKGKKKEYVGTYTTSANLNLRTGAGTKNPVILTIPKNSKVSCYGYFTNADKTPWLFVSYGKYTGYVSSKYLTKNK